MSALSFAQRPDARAESAQSLPVWWWGRLGAMAAQLHHRGRAPWEARRAQQRMRQLDADLDLALARAEPVDWTRLKAQRRHRGHTAAGHRELLATVAATATRVLGRRPYATQLLAAWGLGEGRFVEMATGEGKTFATALAAATAALAGQPVLVLTANDYLAERDARAHQALFAALGLSVGVVRAGDDTARRQAAYRCDLTFTTAQELGFDYLRDSRAGVRPAAAAAGTAPWQAGGDDAELLPWPASDRGGDPIPSTRCLRGLAVALLDEADSLLIDEASLPLLLSEPEPLDPRQAAAGAAAQRAVGFQALTLAAGLHPGEHFTPGGPGQTPRLTPAGQAWLEERAQALGGVWRNRRWRRDLMQHALQAQRGLRAERDYLVQDGRVVLVDTHTGRAVPGRQWPRQLQTLVEVKERCPISPTTRVVARISLQRLFGRCLHLAGTSGTLHEAAGELLRTWGRPILRVPLRQPCRRRLGPVRLFATAAEREAAAVRRVAALHARGQPVLVGVDSVAAAHSLGQALQAAGIPHQRLDAGSLPGPAAPVPAPGAPASHRPASAQAATEAHRVARAGQLGAVTVATQMAGRGTDILLGDGVAERGGLHVLCCQDNASGRLDRQFIGRSARGGDPGSAEIWRCLQAAAWQDPADPAERPGAGVRLVDRLARGLLARHAAGRRSGGSDSSSGPDSRNRLVEGGPPALPAWLAAWFTWRQRRADARQARLRRQLMEQDLEWHTRIHRQP